MVRGVAVALSMARDLAGSRGGKTPGKGAR